MSDIYLNKVNMMWNRVGFKSIRTLSSWVDNLKHRLDQLNLWAADPINNLKCTFLNRLFRPECFLTAIHQGTSRDNNQDFNKLKLQTNVLKKLYWESDLPPCNEGAYVFGF